MRKLCVLLASLALSSAALASDTVGYFNPGPAGPVQSNGTYKLVPFTGCSAGVPLLSWTGACVASVSVPVTVPQGGTGVVTLTTHGILLGEGTGNVVATAALAADNLLLGQGASADPAAVALVNCGDATHALGYSTGTHTFACQAISTGTPGGSTTQVQFNLTGAFAGDAGFTYVGSSTQTIGLGTATTGPTINVTASSSLGKTFAINGSGGGVGSDGGPINLTGGTAGSGGTGGALALLGGLGNGGSSGGAVSYKGGTPGLTGVGGTATLSGGPGGGTSGAGGAASVTGGNATTSGVGGAVSITGGTSIGTNQAGSNVTLTAGSPTGSGAVGLISLASPATFSSSLRSIGTKFTLGTGTGACATTSTLVGGAVAGSFVCTGTAGASTQIINLPTVTNGYSCAASDVTSGVAWATQVGTTSTGKIAGTITTTSDVVAFHCIGY